MDTNFYIVIAVLKSLGYEHKMQDRSTVSEPDFVPFDLSYLRDFPGQGEQEKNASRGYRRNVSKPLPA
jgi:hypothetical protein